MDTVAGRRLAAAKDLRQRQTAAEVVLWSCLRRGQIGVKFRRQHPIGPFVVDFCCLSAHLILELDGAVHERPDVREQDEWRSDYLAGHGFRVIRFANEDVLDRTEIVLASIRASLLAEG